MELKFYLNKFVKVDNIEGYTLFALKELKKAYDKFLEDSDGIDPDFPGLNFGGKGKNVVKGKTNVENLEDRSEHDLLTLMKAPDDDAYREADAIDLRKHNNHRRK